MPKKRVAEDPNLSHPSVKRGKQIDEDPPYDQLTEAVDAQEEKFDVTGVAHWFRRDIRIEDNNALHAASEAARAAKKPLITFWVECHEQDEWHGLSPARLDFIVETLRGLQKQLKELNIPLCFVKAENRKDQHVQVLEFLKANKVSHLHANFEYEVDELRRDLKLVRSSSDTIHSSFHHDQCIMVPGSMTTGAGSAMKVFTPFHKTWLAEVKENPDLIATTPNPGANEKSASKTLSKLFDAPLPSIPENKHFESAEKQKTIRKLWPAGHAAAIKRLTSFLKTKVNKYAETRSNPALDSTSRLSPYFAVGALSIREALSACQAHNDDSSDFSPTGASAGISAWVRELVFRELYRQTIATTPHTSMNLSTNLKFQRVKWERDEEGWTKWCEGRTGVPFVDAGMRQLQAEAYMHNRLRMNVSSWLTCNLLLDPRRGERFFAENLVDWDMCNNTMGWEPSWTVFSPTGQAEKNDPQGDYIRKWVPELKDVQGKAVFEPHSRLGKGKFEKLGYPRPHVDWAETKQRALARFKEDMM